MDEKIFAICKNSKLTILNMDLKVKKRTGQEIHQAKLHYLVLTASQDYVAHNGEIDGVQKVTVYYRNLKKVLVSCTSILFLVSILYLFQQYEQHDCYTICINKQTIASGGHDPGPKKGQGTIKVWDIVQKKQLYTLGDQHY